MPKTTIYTNETEADIQGAILDYLCTRRVVFWRNNNVPVFDVRRQQYRRMPKYTPRGLPDIVVVKDGRFVGLEVKSRKGTQFKAQKEFEEWCREEGAEYHVVRSIEDVQALGI